MRETVLHDVVAGAAIALLLAFASPSYAETVQFKADLKGAAEVPPNQTTGSGTITATYDTSTKQLAWDGSYTGLTGPATAAHFHGPANRARTLALLYQLHLRRALCTARQL